MIRTFLAAVCLVATLAACSGVPGAGESVPTPGAGPVSSSSPGVPGAELWRATDMRPGDCLEPMPVDTMVTVVPCGVPHSAEFVATYVLTAGEWPGEDMARQMENGCAPRMRRVLAEHKEMGLAGLAPAELDWPRDRTVYCLAAPTDGGRTVGRLAN
ncbi:MULTISPECIES: hypothetical protein [unclassified Nonomuraea]|uniref:hypothetical protein n=1 Tax=unclassified Nonomuraea TaxID=2593643 RepID=UPI0033DCB99C